jgi:uncharacterized DUF497 family protein
MGRLRLEWDASKDRLNRGKHGVAFEIAQRAFRDTARVIAEDVQRSGVEKRYYCFGRVEDRIMTVRFTHHGSAIRTIGEIRVVKDFLPPPDQLVMKEENVKVTLGLSKRSVQFFKREARRQGIRYQRMIRSLLDMYASHHEGAK